jgi:hypothetical protein
VIWHAQVGNLNEALHQINLRDMLDASMLTERSVNIALEELGARADKAGLQQSFNNFLAAHDQLVGTRRQSFEPAKPLATHRAAAAYQPTESEHQDAGTWAPLSENRDTAIL